MKNIFIVTTARSEFGILKNIIIEVSKIKKIKLTLIVSGTHLTSKYGKTINEINELKLKNLKRIKVLDGVEPEANCSLNPKTLKLLNIDPGEEIILETRRGKIHIMARSDPSVAEDNVFMPFAFVEAAANILTNSALDPYGKIPEFKYSAVRVEKINKKYVTE